MRASGLLFLLLLAAGCRGTPKEAPLASERDYLSLNRGSVDFLFETARTGEQMRRDNLRESTDFRPRIEEGRRRQRESVSFAAEATVGDMWRESGNLWADLKSEFRWEKKKFRSSVRFGQVDSGD